MHDFKVNNLGTDAAKSFIMHASRDINVRTLKEREMQRVSPPMRRINYGIMSG